MTLLELHPDELLWRDACGTLTPDERADLSAHMQRCPACALERAVRIEAARARVPSEADHAIAARLVDRVLATHERRPVTAIRDGGRRPLAVAAAVIVLAAGTAFAATALVARVQAERATRALALTRPAPGAETAARRYGSEAGPAGRLPETGPASDTTAAAGEGQIPRVALPTRDPRDQRSLRDNSRFKPRPLRSGALAFAPSGPRPRTAHPEQASEGSPAAPSQSSSPMQAAARLGPTPERAAGRVSAPPAVLPPVPSAPAVAESALEAPQLLRRAEQARTARRWADAGRAFVDLGRRFPGTREEIVGRALYGQVLLDQLGEPRRALTMFERYLAVDPSGALAEEARLGRAQALRRLGQPHEERSAWLELMREHPGSVHVAAARTRLAALDAP